MITFDGIGTLLGNHVHGILDATVGNDGDVRCINHAKVLDAVDLEAGINHTLLDVLRQTSSAAGMERGLRAIEYSPLYKLIVMQRHGLGIFVLDDIFKALTIFENIISVTDALADGDNIEIIVEVVEVDVGLL